MLISIGYQYVLSILFNKHCHPSVFLYCLSFLVWSSSALSTLTSYCSIFTPPPLYLLYIIYLLLVEYKCSSPSLYLYLLAFFYFLLSFFTILIMWSALYTLITCVYQSIWTPTSSPSIFFSSKPNPSLYIYLVYRRSQDIFD